MVSSVLSYFTFSIAYRSLAGLFVCTGLQRYPCPLPVNEYEHQEFMTAALLICISAAPPGHVYVARVQALSQPSYSLCFVPASGNVPALKKEEVFLYEIGGNIGKNGFQTASGARRGFLGPLSVGLTVLVFLFMCLVLPDAKATLNFGEQEAETLVWSSCYSPRKTGAVTDVPDVCTVKKHRKGG